MFKKGSCPVCNSESDVQVNYDTNSAFHICPVCGRYELTYSGHALADNPRLASYLYYNRFLHDGLFGNRYHTTLNKETCDEYRKQFDDGNNTHGRPVHMDVELIENWYPKSFSEKVDLVLLQINSLTKHIGQWLDMNSTELFSLLFVDRKEVFSGKTDWRHYDSCIQEALYILQFFDSQSLIECDSSANTMIGNSKRLRLTPQGYSKVDELQKNNAAGKNVLVAMKFGDETVLLREAIRAGIQNAGYHAVFIDEVQHNNFITPELLKCIRDSKFVVVDLTHQNNGAYFEEGYAMGLGKSVIQLCKKNAELHFDIAQKNTIMWESEEEIPDRLTNRIKATID